MTERFNPASLTIAEKMIAACDLGIPAGVVVEAYVNILDIETKLSEHLTELLDEVKLALPEFWLVTPHNLVRTLNVWIIEAVQQGD